MILRRTKTTHSRETDVDIVVIRSALKYQKGITKKTTFYSIIVRRQKQAGALLSRVVNNAMLIDISNNQTTIIVKSRSSENLCHLQSSLVR